MTRKRLGAIDKDSITQMRDVAERKAAERRGMAAGKAPPIGKMAGSAARNIEDELLQLRQKTQSLQTQSDAFAAAKDAGLVIELVALDEIEAHAMTRDRRALDRDCEAWDELKDSLRARGQQTPIEISGRSSLNGKYRLISGYRRLSALRELWDETQDPQFAKVKALITGGKDKIDAMVAMIEENEIRQDISFYERGRICCLAAEQGICASVDEAIETLFPNSSRNRRYKIRNFTLIHTQIGAVLDYPEQIGERLGARLAQALKDGREADLIAVLSDRDTKFSDAAEELQLLSDFVGQQGRFAAPKSAPEPALSVAWTGQGVKARAELRNGRAVLKLDGVAVADAEELEELLAMVATAFSAKDS